MTDSFLIQSGDVVQVEVPEPTPVEVVTVLGPTGNTGPTGPTGETGPAGTTTWAGITDKPAVIAAGTDVIAARTVIGAEDVSQKGIAGGYAPLDSAGKVAIAYLPSSLMEYAGTFNASTNTPTLVNGTGNAGDVYRVSVAGTRNFGAGSITFRVGDYVIYNGSEWEKSATTDNVASVNGYKGDVTLVKADLGLASVDNTSDGAKNAATAALTNKDLTSGTNTFPALVAPQTTAATSKTTPVDADELPLTDSAATFGLKKLTWANLKAAIAAYYDSLTSTLSNKTIAAPVLTGTTKVAQSGVLELYNTADQTTNYERVTAYWNGTTFTLASTAGGTGTARSMTFSTPVTSLTIARNNNAVNGMVQVSAPSSSAGVAQFGTSGALTASSGLQNSINIAPSLNQSGTAGYAMLLINPTENATGSGTKRLIDAQVGGVSKFTVDNAGAVTGTSFSAGLTSTATAAGTTTLTSASTQTQVFTGNNVQAVLLPTTGIVAGQQYQIINNSNQSVTVQSSGANTILAVGASTAATFTALVATPTTAANWKHQLTFNGSTMTGASFVGTVAIGSGVQQPNITLGATANVAYAASAGAWSDLSSTGDLVLRSGASNVLLTARNSTGAIVFTTGATETEKMRLSNAGNLTVTGTVQANGNPVGVKVAVPASATATGVLGQWAADTSYIYVCTAANVWARAALTTW